METDRTKIDSRERKQVNIYEEWEVAYWLNNLGCTRLQLEKAVTEVGPSAEKVRNYFAAQKFIV
ncbi:MAG TPA: DUF3606 domain-containing protein [Chitinophagales bacterium]|nr:DUF3606 domain-containing protein [Chitinophagales bacterium]